MHEELFALVCMSWAATWLALRGLRGSWLVAAAGGALTLASIAITPRAAQALVPDDNVRRVLTERSPVLGRACRVAIRLAPPDATAAASTEAPGDAAFLRPRAAGRMLDWTDRDIVLVTVDALRADHVSSYGYARKTTPNIDRMAERGTRFEHAYCPTPHTSYSVVSMMAGKYMRPLLSMGTGEDSDLWATYMRQYGFRTAAFFPPAVFFVDEHRFSKFERDGLGFEYRKVEFATPDLRIRQVGDYVASAPIDRPLFLWVHIFEPHEPYEMHEEHRFAEGQAPLDAYDSEVATADAIVGKIVALVEAREPNAVFIVSADHGEEFGEHGGSYHGTTVYEEQVRVPLVIAGAGVRVQTVASPVQTIDLLPTTLGALNIPRPARLRGRDLGAILAQGPSDEGLAFSETDEAMLVARGSDRLVCLRTIASCTLFNVAEDPGEQHADPSRPARSAELRRVLTSLTLDHGRIEASDLPASLRRGLQGDKEADEEVSALLDDARVDIRRAAAKCLFRLRSARVVAQLARASGDEDAAVRSWSALALYRSGSSMGKGPTVGSLLRDEDVALRGAAALALAEQGDGRGEGELAAWWERAFVPGAAEPGELPEARELLAALVRLRSRAATMSLVASLADVRLRPLVVSALQEIGDPRAKSGLLDALARERYVEQRGPEANALLKLGARGELWKPLAAFAGAPTPLPNAIFFAKDAGLLRANQGGWSGHALTLTTSLAVPGKGPARILVATAGPGELVLYANGALLRPTRAGDTWTVELDDLPTRVGVHLEHPGGVTAIWIVRRGPDPGALSPSPLTFSAQQD